MKIAWFVASIFSLGLMSSSAFAESTYNCALSTVRQPGSQININLNAINEVFRQPAPQIGLNVLDHDWVTLRFKAKSPEQSYEIVKKLLRARVIDAEVKYFSCSAGVYIDPRLA